MSRFSGTEKRDDLATPADSVLVGRLQWTALPWSVLNMVDMQRVWASEIGRWKKSYDTALLA
jgi:hypothetical protein